MSCRCNCSTSTWTAKQRVERWSGLPISQDPHLRAICPGTVKQSKGIWSRRIQDCCLVRKQRRRIPESLRGPDNPVQEPDDAFDISGHARADHSPRRHVQLFSDAARGASLRRNFVRFFLTASPALVRAARHPTDRMTGGDRGPWRRPAACAFSKGWTGRSPLRTAP